MQPTSGLCRAATEYCSGSADAAARCRRCCCSGKLKLASQCSHCAYQLPRRGYSVPTLHIPVAGAPQVGKSVFMFASVKRLYDSVVGDETMRHFWADESFKNTFLQTKETIGNPEEMRKTTVTRPNAYNIYLGTGKLRRLVYLYDSAGEIYDDSRALSEADFYRLTKGLVLCVDPFSLAGLRRQVDAATLDNVRSLDKDPKDVLERLTENLREWRIRGRGTSSQSSWRSSSPKRMPCSPHRSHTPTPAFRR